MTNYDVALTTGAVLDKLPLKSSWAPAHPKKLSGYSGTVPGLTVETDWAAEDGRVSGTVGAPGVYVLQVLVFDGMGNPDNPSSDTFTVTVTGGGTPDTPPDDGGDGEDPTPDTPPADDDPALSPFELHATLARSLAPHVAAFVGAPGDKDVTATAEAQIAVVTEYVRGYTRGRGFRGEAPELPLRVVIVSAVARLATNPEQVAYYTSGDYSEKPAQLAGWTLTELGVLRRYRRTAA